MNTNHICTTIFLALSLSGCNTNTIRSSTGVPDKNIGSTELISKTMSEVKDGAAVLEKFFIEKKATIQSTELLDQ